ncbi:MAG: DEAD/DEAH box helicase [Lachnospiraceae bacterium]|nr:DEAD/DEAH box helicase [Lachnospiraceae bacterium]
MPKDNKAKLRFLFTKSGFVLDSGQEIEDKEIVKWKKRFEKDRYQALYDLGFLLKPEWLDGAGSFLYRVADCFQKMLTRQPDLELVRSVLMLEPDEDMLSDLVISVPFAPGSENIDKDWTVKILSKMLDIYCNEIKNFEGTVALYLAEKSQKLKVPERIFFHLVENTEEEYSFAFLATYATKVKGNRIQHKPLAYALTEYKGDRGRLMELLSCLEKATAVSPLIDEFVKSGEMFHPLRMTSEEAYQFLKAVPAIEKSGIICRVPNWWKKKASTVAMQLKLGEKKPSMFGLQGLVSMQPELSVDGVRLTGADIRNLLEMTEGLAYLKGKWIEVNHERLHAILEAMEGQEGQISLMEAIRMQMKAAEPDDDPDGDVVISNGKWLSGLLSDMRNPKDIRKLSVPRSFRATLRPYQENGYKWLSYMNKLGFGACLADDMGLGKTVQVLAFLEKLRKDKKDARVLLVVPASLIGNWKKEAEKFAPSMPITILHGAGASGAKRFDTFLTVTTYGMTLRIGALLDQQWDALILDEAQAIKNPVSKQTKQIKKLQAALRIAMTGTPIENDLTNLWSLFDFLNKGLLGSAEEFRQYCSTLDERPEGYARLKGMISPFMLRRVKTDKSIIADLPDKLEQVDYVELSKKQAVLYKKYVSELEKILLKQKKEPESMSDFQRKGIVLASIMKLKQICNHPDQYLGQTGYEEMDSGKFSMLREICETIYEKRERVLVFTQFTEVIPYLDDYLSEIFHTRGLVLHGGVRVKTRAKLVEQFQGEEYIPYMILSVKAGGTGLNLTNASHVIHFDRWWNPAVENQATDRAFRIGQKNNVIVHKLVCRGTIEEKIDALINSKKDLAENVIGSGGENWITEMSNDELMEMLRLE